MYTIISFALLLLMFIFSVLLLFKSKKSRQMTLEEGKCPSCEASFKSFKDEQSGSYFKVDVIHVKLLKNHGCSGIKEYEYRCSSCGLVEVHNSVGQGCSV